MEQGKRGRQKENAHRVDELMNLEEKYVRTQRHLENNSAQIKEGRINSEQLEHTQELQHERSQEMQNIKNKIVYEGREKKGPQSQLQNTEQRYEFSQGYLESNADHMTSQDRRNLEQKQQNRKEFMSNMNKTLK